MGTIWGVSSAQLASSGPDGGNVTVLGAAGWWHQLGSFHSSSASVADAADAADAALLLLLLLPCCCCRAAAASAAALLLRCCCRHCAAAAAVRRALVPRASEGLCPSRQTGRPAGPAPAAAQRRASDSRPIRAPSAHSKPARATRASARRANFHVPRSRTDVMRSAARSASALRASASKRPPARRPGVPGQLPSLAGSG